MAGKQELAVIDTHYQEVVLGDLAKRGFQDIVIEGMFEILPPNITKEEINFSTPALKIIYHDQYGEVIPRGHRYKLYHSAEDIDRSLKKLPKYIALPNEPPHIYLSPILTEKIKWESVFTNIEHDIVITEGEFKSAMACMHGFITVSLSGVWSWKSTKFDMPFLPELEAIKWRDDDGGFRSVYLAFDADVQTNPKVYHALHALADMLTSKGAKVFICTIPTLDGVKGTGLDDYLVHPSGGPNRFEEILAESPAFSCCATLIQLNMEVSYVEDPGLMVRRDTDRLFKPYDFSSHAFSNRYFWEISPKGKMDKKKAAPAWLDWEGRSALTSLTYRPGEDKVLVDRTYNLWNGWGVSPVEGDITPWAKLLDFFFKADKPARKWFEQWCAYPLQNPGKKQSVAVLIWGALQGTGKTLIGNTLGAIHGAKGATHNYIEVGNAELNSSFNQWAKNKTFIHCDEITGSDNMARQDRFKKLITQSKQQINEKGIGGYEIPDCATWYFTSNSPSALYLEAMDRRFFIWEVIGQLEEEFFEEDYVNNWLRKDGPSHLLHHLLNNVDCSDFKPHARSPHTVFKQAMIEGSKGVVANWIIRLGDIDNNILEEAGATCDLYTVHQLMAIFRATEGDNDHTHQVTFRNNMLKTGFRQLPPIKVKGKLLKLFAIRNPKFWEGMVETNNEEAMRSMRAHFEEHNPGFGDSK